MTAGQRVLDVGSSVGDVALLAARLVGPTGEVVGMDRDGVALAKARTRAAAAALSNIRFVEADIATSLSGAQFDAVVGRLILQFFPDPVAALRSLGGRSKAGRGRGVSRIQLGEFLGAVRAPAFAVALWNPDLRDVPALRRPNQHGPCFVPRLSGSRSSPARAQAGNANRMGPGDSAVGL